MQVVEIAPTDVLKGFSKALSALKTKLAAMVPSYQDVRLTQIAKEGQWWLDEENKLIGKSWMLGLLTKDPDGVPDETTMVWNGEGWQLADELKEVHMDDPWVEPHTFGGAEPVPGDEGGKDQRAATAMTMESIRGIVRSILREVV